MPRALSLATVIEKNRIASNVAFVPLLQIDVKDPSTGTIVETLYFARNPEDIIYQGNTYVAGAFDFDITTEANNQPQMNVTVRDMTRAVQAQMQQYGGGIGFNVRVLIVNTGNLTQPPEAMESFSVISAQAKDYNAIFKLGADNPLTMRCPRRRQFRDICQWRYKGQECGYTGDLATCDFTMNGANGCNAHGNAIRFGAFPGIGIDQNQGPQ